MNIYKTAFWINWAMTIFFAFMLLIMFVVIGLYWALLGEPRVTLEEFHSLIIFTVLLTFFVLTLGVTTWATKLKKAWWVVPEIGAVSVAVGAVLFLQSFA